MSSKVIDLPGVGAVTLIKRPQSRSIRLSVTGTGVRVSLPKWTPFAAGEAFARQHGPWIRAELTKQQRPLLESGQKIGKLHYLRFEQVLSGQATTSRVTATEVVVRLNAQDSITDTAVQKRATTAAARALKREADRLLPPRLRSLADKHGHTYESVGVKSLKRRWGSCDNRQNIVLNIYLMELPWEFVDYVLLHELAHTKHMNHGADFWGELGRMLPNARALSKQLRTHQPTLGSWQPSTS